MEEIKIGHQISHLLRGESRNPRCGLRHFGKDRGALIPHDRGNLSEALVKSLGLLPKVVCHFSSLASDGMAFDTALRNKDLLTFSRISRCDKSYFLRPLRIRFDIFEKVHH